MSGVAVLPVDFAGDYGHFLCSGQVCEKDSQKSQESIAWKKSHRVSNGLETGG